MLNKNIIIKENILNYEIFNNTILETPFPLIVKRDNKNYIGKPIVQNTNFKYFKNLKPNKIRKSFNNRFLMPIQRFLYLRTVLQSELDLNEDLADFEKSYYDYLENHMPGIERREIYKKSLNGFTMNLVSMSNRLFSYTKAFVSHCVSNSFVTLFRGRIRDTYYMKVLAKVSCGLIGYKGPKKSTVFARKGVIKQAGFILANKMTSLLDVVFTSKVSRWNRKSVRDLCPNLSYVLNIYITYTRSHGYTKHKNKRRT
jgi:hypothetical protein